MFEAEIVQTAWSNINGILKTNAVCKIGEFCGLGLSNCRCGEVFFAEFVAAVPDRGAVYVEIAGNFAVPLQQR